MVRSDQSFIPNIRSISFSSSILTSQQRIPGNLHLVSPTLVSPFQLLHLSRYQCVPVKTKTYHTTRIIFTKLLVSFKRLW